VLYLNQLFDYEPSEKKNLFCCYQGFKHDVGNKTTKIILKEYFKEYFKDAIF